MVALSADAKAMPHSMKTKQNTPNHARQQLHFVAKMRKIPRKYAMGRASYVSAALAHALDLTHGLNCDSLA